MIEHPFLSIPAKTACPGKLRLIFSKISRATRLAGFESSLLPLDSNHSISLVLVSQEVRGMHANTQQHRGRNCYLLYYCSTPFKCKHACDTQHKGSATYWSLSSLHESVGLLWLDFGNLLLITTWHAGVAEALANFFCSWIINELKIQYNNGLNRTQYSASLSMVIGSLSMVIAR